MSDWMDYQQMGELGVHAYDARGRRIARVRAVRQDQGGISVRAQLFSRRDDGTYESGVIGEPSEDLGPFVVYAEAHVPGGFIATDEERAKKVPRREAKDRRGSLLFLNT